MDKLANIDKYVARLLMVSFFLPMTLQVVVVVPCALYFAGRTLIEKGTISSGNLLWAVALGSLFLLYFIAWPLSPLPYRDAALQICGNKLALLLMPVAFALTTPGRRQVIFNELIWFVYICFILLLAGNLYFINKYALSSSGFHGVNHVTYRVFFEAFTNLHPTYLSMYLVLSICILMLQGQKVNRTIKYILFYFLLVFLISLLAKAPLIAMALIFMHYAWINRSSLWQKHKWVFTGAIALMGAAYAFIPFISQRINEIAGRSKAISSERFMDNSINVRKLIWTIDTNMLQHYWLTGVGPARLIHLLRERYFFYSLYLGYDLSYYDPHNQYFYDWLSLGVLGFLVLAATMVIHFATAIKSRQWLYLYLIGLLVVTFCTESVLGRQQGLMFYSIFTGLFFFLFRQRSIKEQ